MSDLFPLQSLLLDLLSPIRPIDHDYLASLGDGEWEALLTMVRQHRLGPLLHWQALQRGHPLPPAVMARLARIARRSGLRALTLQRELVLLGRILREAQIPYMALKGAYLAFMAYPAPRLRPLRDIDILVPRAQVLAAYQALLDGGLARHPEHPGDPASALAHAKHLQPLLAASGQISVELHACLFGLDLVGPGAPDPADTGDFWARRTGIPLAGETLGFESPTDLLLHLIVHAVYDHEFNNGPLLLSDLAFLVRAQRIDWRLFWRLAREGGFLRGCALALSLTEHYWGQLEIDWPPDAGRACNDHGLPLQSSIALMLQDVGRRQFVAMATELSAGSMSDRARILWRKVFPSRESIAARFPVRSDAPWMYFWYPVLWWQLASRVMPYASAARHSGQAGELRHLRSLASWLQAER